MNPTSEEDKRRLAQLLAEDSDDEEEPRASQPTTTATTLDRPNPDNTTSILSGTSAPPSSAPAVSAPGPVNPPAAPATTDAAAAADDDDWSEASVGDGKLWAVDIWLRQDAPTGHHGDPQHQHHHQQLLALVETVVLGQGLVVKERREGPEATWVVGRAASTGSPASASASAAESAASLFVGLAGTSWSTAVLRLGVTDRGDDRTLKHRRLRVDFLRTAASMPVVVAVPALGPGGRADKTKEEVGGALVRALTAALREAELLRSQCRREDPQSPLDPHYVLELLAWYARAAADGVKTGGRPDEVRAREEELRGATLVAALQPAFARHGRPMPGPTRARPLKEFALEGLARPALGGAVTLEQARALVAKFGGAVGPGVDAAARRVCQELAAWAEAEQGAQLRRRRRQVEERVGNVRAHRRRLVGALRDHAPTADAEAAVERPFWAAFFPEEGRRPTVLVDVPATLDARPGRLYVTAEGVYFHSQILSFSLRRALPFARVRFVEGSGGKGAGLWLAAAAAATGSALAVTDVEGAVHTFFLMAAIDMVDVVEQVLGVWREGQRVAAAQAAAGAAAEEVVVVAAKPTPESAPKPTAGGGGVRAADEAGKASDEGKGMEEAHFLFEGLSLSAAAAAVAAPALSSSSAGRSGSSLREGLQAFFGGEQPQRQQSLVGEGGSVTPARERRGSRESHSPLLDLSD